MEELKEVIENLTKGLESFKDTTAAEVKAAKEAAEDAKAKVAGIEKRTARAELEHRDSEPEPLRYRAADGRELKAYTCKHDLRKHIEGFNPDLGPNQFGATVVGMACGKWSNPDLRTKAQSTGSNTAGGYLVPDNLSAQIISEALNQSVVMRAGARIVDIPGGNLRITRVSSTPTAAPKNENEAITADDVVFDAIELVPITFGTLTYASLELMQDSPNAAAAIESAIMESFAVELDRLALRGSGSGTLTGLFNLTGVQSTTSVGAIDYDALLDAVEDIQDNNGVADAIIMPPALSTGLAKLKSGDGSTSAALYLDPPRALEGVRMFTSNQAETGYVYVGQFASNAIWGLRMAPTVQVSDVAGDTFKQGQVAIRVLWRGDVAAERANRLVRLSGVTAS